LIDERTCLFRPSHTTQYNTTSSNMSNQDENNTNNRNSGYCRVERPLEIGSVEVATVETLSEHPPIPDIVLADVFYKQQQQPPDGTKKTVRAFYASSRPTHEHFHSSRQLHAAIVTCGGLCPGLNNVVREITLTLHHRYNVHRVYGVRGGWHGFCDREYPPVVLTPETVDSVHHQGGSFLRTSRGGLDLEAVHRFLTKYQISLLFILGGDGTHRGAYKVHEHCREHAMNVAVVGIPKTIDNDIDFIDRSFGFHSAVEAAQASIRTALVEAKCTVPNGIGVIKLMGREAGFLAAYAALGSGGDVDAVLVPEVPVVLRGEDGILPFLQRRVLEKGYAVCVVAEGAGQELLEGVNETELGSGNKKLPPIAEYVRDQIQEYFAEQGLDCRMKYVDPSYSVRSVPANAADSLYCIQLGQGAVYGAMAGYTGFSVGRVNNRIVYIPIPQLVASSPRFMNPKGDIWQQILSTTGQPTPSDSSQSSK
jgi:6-phosphofructokinase 1